MRLPRGYIHLYDHRFQTTALPINAKFHVEPHWEEGRKVYINGPSNMTKMATMPIYGKKPSNIFYRTNSHMYMKLDMEYYILNFYKVYINNGSETNLFTTMSNLAKLVFVLILKFCYLSLLSRSFSDHHLRCGGWLNLEFSKREKHSGWAIKTIYKK